MKVNLRGLYVITRPMGSTRALCDAVDAALKGGASLVQYRDKTQDTAKRKREAQALIELCHDHDVGLIINDDVKLAEVCQADGVHLGRGDMALDEARAILGHDACIGISCYNDRESAVAAEGQGANYVGFGSFYPSPTKPDAVRAAPDLLAWAHAALRIPVCAIGGITPYNAQPLLAAGADMVAAVSAIFDATDNQEASARFARLFA